MSLNQPYNERIGNYPGESGAGTASAASEFMRIKGCDLSTLTRER